MFNVEKFPGPIISVMSQGSGEYFYRVRIGEPASPTYMDTGSNISWVQCAPCADCDPIFEPASSALYVPLSCEATQCKWLDQSECRNGNCLYEVSYRDGSYTVDDFVMETVTVGDASFRNIAIRYDHNNEGLYVSAAGLLGLDGGSLSFPAQLNSTSFSYCLVDRDSDSVSTLEFDSLFPLNDVTAPLRRSWTRFTMRDSPGSASAASCFRFPKRVLRWIPQGAGVIVDSGTAVTQLQSDMSLFDTCYDLSSKTSVQVPRVAFYFREGEVVALPTKNYLIPVDSVGTFYFAFAPTISAFSIIGNIQQQGDTCQF